MAGLGAKLFTDGSVLNAEQVNGYLMDQSIMRFASAAARDLAFGGIGEPTLAEGMMCYLNDTNVLQSYNGSTWVTLLDSDSPPAMQLIKTQTFASQSTINVVGCFSSEFDNYRIIINLTGGSAAGGNALFLRPNNISTAIYGGSIMRSYGATINALANVGDAYLIGYTTSVSTQYHLVGDIAYPNQPLPTTFTFQAFGYNSIDNVNYAGGCNMYSFAQYTDITLSVQAGTITGTVSVYGYRK